ncbi:MAG: YhdP family protein, partial [bacterium]
IVVVGDTNLIKQEYDQKVFVVPAVGQSLPILGALAGGPVGAAAMVAVGSMLSKNMNESGGQVYSVTGAWDEPQVIKIKNNALPAKEEVQPAKAESETKDPDPAIIEKKPILNELNEKNTH